MFDALRRSRPTRAVLWGGAAIVLALCCAPACKRSAPADVAATVNNRAITYAELERTYQQSQLSTPGQSEEQTMAQRLEVLRGLIDSEIMLQRAEKQGLLAGDADVEAKLTELKAPWTKEQFEQQLRDNKMSLDDLKSKIRRDLSIQKLINKDITSHIVITDADVTAFYNANKAGYNFPETRIHMAQILVTPNPEPNAGNLQNSKAQNDAEANRKIHEIYTRLQRGEDFALVAHSYSEDPSSAPNGGDIGFIPESALDKANVELRKMVMSLAPGAISPIIKTQEGYRIFKIISKESAGQRELNDPRVQQSIRETLLNRKDQLLKSAYYEVARNEAKVVNYLARSVAEGAAAPVGQMAAQPKGTEGAEQKFACKSPGAKDDHFVVNFDAKTVQSGDVVLGGPNGPTEYRITDVRISPDAITFTQRLNLGPVVGVRHVSIDRRDGGFTSKYEGGESPSKGTCSVVKTF